MNNLKNLYTLIFNNNLKLKNSIFRVLKVMKKKLKNFLEINIIILLYMNAWQNFIQLKLILKKLFLIQKTFLNVCFASHLIAHRLIISEEWSSSNSEQILNSILQS